MEAKLILPLNQQHSFLSKGKFKRDRYQRFSQSINVIENTLELNVNLLRVEEINKNFHIRQNDDWTLVPGQRDSCPSDGEWISFHCLIVLVDLGCITGSLVKLGFHYFYFCGYLRDVITEVSNFIEIVASSFSRLSAFAASDSSMFLDELLFVQPRRRFILPRMNEESIRFVQLQVLLGCTSAYSSE